MKTQIASFERTLTCCPAEIFFPEGIIGFEKHKEYAIINEKSKEPFFWMQAKDNPEAAFIIIDPKEFMAEYDPILSNTDKTFLRVEQACQCQCFSIICVPKDSDKITANLLAPLFINQRENIGRQVVLQDQDYSVQYLILDEMLKKIEDKNVSTFSKTK